MREPALEGARATGHEEGTEKRTAAPKTLETGVTDQQARLHQPEREDDKRKERRAKMEEVSWKKRQEAVIFIMKLKLLKWWAEDRRVSGEVSLVYGLAWGS